MVRGWWQAQGSNGGNTHEPSLLIGRPMAEHLRKRGLRPYRGIRRWSHAARGSAVRGGAG
ncbi:hypothetical protein BC2230_10028 [Burkholderia cepacia]